MSLKNLKISIITINYNNASGLEKTIQSVKDQTYKNIEYIVIDGNSPDASVNVIKTSQTRINYWVSEADSGIYNAMNKGIKAATGDYLLFINSGDILINAEVIAQAIAFGLSRDLVYGNLLSVKEENRREWIPDEALSFQTFFDSTIPHPCTFIKKELFEIVGLYNESHAIIADWEFFLLAICKHNCTYKHINLFLTEFYEDGISSDPQNLGTIIKERQEVLKKHFPSFVKDYEKHRLLNEEMDKIKYFLKVRKFAKSLFRQRIN